MKDAELGIFLNNINQFDMEYKKKYMIDNNSFFKFIDFRHNWCVICHIFIEIINKLIAFIFIDGMIAIIPTIFVNYYYVLSGAVMGSIRKKTMSKDRILGRHLLLLVFIKIVILYGLWYVFIKPNKVKVDVSDVQRLYQGGASAPPEKQFNQNQRSQPWLMQAQWTLRGYSSL